MARPLRIEFAGALYHVTARGNAREDIYGDDIDRQQFLSLLQSTVTRYDWYCHAYCLMDNHYHLLIETNTPTLSKGMKFLNGTYTQYYNRQHHRVGHVFQGRFKAILVQKESYLLELARYIVLNPVRARRVRSANEWRWSRVDSHCNRTTSSFHEDLMWRLVVEAFAGSMIQFFHDFCKCFFGNVLEVCSFREISS